MQKRARGWVALSTKRKLGAFHIQTHSEHCKHKHTQIITNTNTFRALQMQAQMDDKYKHKHKQEEDEEVRELKAKVVPRADVSL